jgi:glutathione synthase/RimK-type ligase-like ATP-grasp enzyme
MQQKNILFVIGIPDDRKILFNRRKKDGSLDVSIGGSTNLYNRIKSDSYKKVQLVLDANPSQDISVHHIHTIFNEIADPDTHKITLGKLEHLSKQLPKGIRLLNPPANIMGTTRENIYQLLQGIEKVHAPKTIKFNPGSPADIYETIEKENFKFPVIFRQAGDHGGVSTIRVDDDTEQFYTFALDGRTYYLTQFVETSQEGLYRKYRLIVIGGKVFLRHVIFGNSWMMHARSQIDPKEGDPLKQKASDTFVKELRPLIQPAVTEIYQRIGLDYFGIDCHIDDAANLLVFEVNAAMNVFVEEKQSIFKHHIQKAQEALVELLNQ